jgi:hypothetical protein
MGLSMGNVSWIAVVGALGLAACQPMYGAKPAKLTTPRVVHHVEPPEPVAEVKYVETCEHVDFRRPSKGVVRDKPNASRLVAEGDARVATAEQATADDARRDLIVDSIERYKSALTKDPYDPDATLKLALAYDRARRKGCALALLRRLDTLSSHPEFAEAANRSKASVRDNTGWFGGYRKDALDAIP